MSDNGFIGRATYSPEDNKLRIYPAFHLPRDVYERVRNAGFIWAAQTKAICRSRLDSIARRLFD